MYIDNSCVITEICYRPMYFIWCINPQVFEAVMSWVQHNLESREDLIERLMEHVRLPLMSQEYLVQRVEEEPLFKTNSRCKDFLIEAMKYHLLKHEQKITFKTPRTQPRNPIGLPKVCRKITLNTLTAQLYWFTQGL